MPKPLEYAVFEWYGYDTPYEERFRLFRRAGFTGTMLYRGDDPSRGQWNLPAMARRAGLSVINVHAPLTGNNTIWLPGDDGDARVDLLCRCIEDNARYEIPVIVVHLTDGSTPPPPGELGIDRLRRITRRAEALGVALAIENLRSAETLRFTLARLTSPAVGFCYDSGHECCRTPDEDFLSEFGNRTIAVHLHDNMGPVNRDDEDDSHLLPFDGITVWQSAAEGLISSAYRGPVALEVYNRGYEHLPPEAFLKLACERAERFARMIARLSPGR